MELKDKVSFRAGDSWSVNSRSTVDTVKEFDEVLELLEETAVSIEAACDLNDDNDVVARHETLVMDDGSVWEYKEDDEELVKYWKRTIRRVS